MNFIKRCSILSVILLIFTMNSSILAANIGEKLPWPESGWTRYDDIADKEFTFIGEQWAVNNNEEEGFYNNAVHYCASTDETTQIKFKFYGTKLRLIAYMNEPYSDKLICTIDGKEYYYSNYSSTKKYQILVLDVQELPLTIHEVNIKNTNNKRISFDAVDIDEDGKLLSYDYTNLTVTTGSSITLSWDKIDGAIGYNVKRSTTQGGKYITLKEGITETSYTDDIAKSNTTYYYVVVPVIDGKERTTSNEASAMIEEIIEPPVDETGNATLIITMTNGNVKQYNVDMVLVNNFINWYTNRASGSSGLPYFSIDKKENLAPYTKKTEYLVFDKISSFEVDEYAQ